MPKITAFLTNFWSSGVLFGVGLGADNWWLVFVGMVIALVLIFSTKAI